MNKYYSGDILLKNIKDKDDIHRLIMSSHFEGRVLGLEFVPENYVNYTFKSILFI